MGQSGVTMSGKTNVQINKEDASIDNSPDSPAVIAYRLGQVETAVKEGFTEHNQKLDAIITNFATKGELQGVSQRLASLESDRVWIVRLVVGAVVFPLMALIGIGFKTFN